MKSNTSGKTVKTYTPLWSSILNSTVWAESKEVKILWITMLAMKDSEGFVESSLVGLAKQAVLTFEETKEAIAVLESPDEKSTTHQEHEGRRVQKVEGGWMVLNHFKYRDEIAKLKRKQQQAQWQRDYRAAKKAASMKGINQMQQPPDDPDFINETPPQYGTDGAA